VAVGSVSGGNFAAPTLRLYDSEAGIEPPECDRNSFGGASFNAFYCPRENFVAIDRALLGVLYPNLGNYAVAFVLGHEWGHAVQAQTSETSDDMEELHADCLAGAWTRELETSSTNLDVSKNARVNVMAAMALHDPTTSPLDTPSVQKRFAAFSTGVESGPSACSTYQ
jgi:predicted metalloprotease